MTYLLAEEGLIPPTSSVRICESWARDGIQGWSTTISTDDKVRVIRAAAVAGAAEIDATSFVPASTTPQFTDATELLSRLMDLNVRVRVLTVNRYGIERVLESQQVHGRIDVCGMPISASEAHNRANLKRTHEEHLLELSVMIETLVAEGIAPLVGIATAFGCPLTGEVPRGKVLELVDWAIARGASIIMLGDTTGMANPRMAHELFSEVLARHEGIEFVAHFHDTRGAGIANALAAIAAGVRTVDASLGGVGGEPATVEQGHTGETGNVCTEDLVALLEHMDIATGYDVRKLLEAGRLVEEIMGCRLRSQVLRAGPVV